MSEGVVWLDDEDERCRSLRNDFSGWLWNDITRHMTTCKSNISNQHALWIQTSVLFLRLTGECESEIFSWGHSLSRSRSRSWSRSLLLSRLLWRLLWWLDDLEDFWRTVSTPSVGTCHRVNASLNLSTWMASHSWPRQVHTTWRTKGNTQTEFRWTNENQMFSP